MTLEHLHVPVDAYTAMPDTVQALIEDAECAIEALLDRCGPIPGLIVSDFSACWHSILAVRDHLRLGDAFCEWGCGIGTVAALASVAGFDACGIEIEPDVVDAGIAWLEEQDCSVELIAGSFVPENCALADLLDSDGDLGMRNDGRSAYDELGMSIDDFDVIYIFPWPGEQQAAMQLFDRYAARGAILMINLGIDGIDVYRKQ